jgi:[acyl-carrier-protein] S-malonyltransferase
MYSILFPGQGSQAPGMGRFLFDNFKAAQDVFEEGSEALSFDLKKLCFEGDDKTLALTENTQPALLCVSTATWRVLKSEMHLKPQAAAGHSIGEYAALVAAESISFAEAMKAVRIRGQAMQSAVPVGQGGMTAVLGLDDEQVRFLCEWTVKESGHSPLSPANFNSPGQVVISGSQKALTWLKNNFKPEVIPGDAKRAKLIPLTVSAPFHCDLMKPAEDKMSKVLKDIKFAKAQFPIVQNFVAELVQDEPALRENLIRQVSAPVLWTQSIKKMRSHGIGQGIECGYGKVVAGLVKKIDSDFKVWSTNSIEDLKLIEENLKASGH